MNNLEINQEINGEEILLKCKGRLDASRAGYLNDYIGRLVREGHYQISMDMTEIEYLSSAGIRALVTNYKDLRAVNGFFCIRTMSESVKQVLGMVGMIDMLTQVTAGQVSSQVEENSNKELMINEYRFQLSLINQKGEAKVEFFGLPELISTSAYKKENARMIRSGENHYAIGLGAIGESFEECRNRFGEYILVEKNLAYLPADGSNKPDYMVSTGQLVASLTELYGLHFSGNFSHLVRFEPEQKNTTIGISQLSDGILQLTGFKNYAFVMVAESAGLIGTSLNKSPTDGNKLFSFPEIKDWINFTTEPAHQKMLVVCVGFTFTEKNESVVRYFRPQKPGSPVYSHAHAAVFPYIPLKKTGIDFSETIDFIFNNADLADVLHLTNDTREIVGLGESQFMQGFCWITPVDLTN